MPHAIDDALAKCLSELDVALVGNDEEQDHVIADHALTDFLTALGYDLVVEKWGRVRKWYA